MRALTLATIDALFSAETKELFCALLTIYLPGETYRVVNNTQDVVSRGNTFTAFPFQSVLTNDSAEHLPELEIRIDNIELELVTILRQLTTPPTVLLEIVSFDRPDSVEIAISDLVLRYIDWDPHVITFRLSHEDIMSARFPGDSYNPEEFAGIF